MKKPSVLLLAILCSIAVSAQRPPRVGLCLSGGGAKGLAHIGLLKVIDSAGIKIDYITGTSMGAIVGGLYSVGYSGKQLEEIARNADWDLLLSNNVPMTDINVEEKDEFGRYIAELPFVGFKPTLPLGIIEGQALTHLLADLCFPIHQVTNFDSLPIPFHCVGADILTGEAVVISKGYLPSAMRASMAIPSVFTPVKMQGHLLVDGGLVRNFPVTDVKEMGADIVIGGYTGGKLYDEVQLNSALKLMYQSASFNRVADSEMQKKLCTILANYDDYLEKYSSASFNSVDSIIDIGYRISMQLYPRLKSLADSMDRLGVFRSSGIKHYFSNKVCVRKIVVEGASDESRDLVLGKLGLTEGKDYSVKQLNDAINRVYGTRFFDRVYYSLEPHENGNTIVVTVRESRKAAFKFGVHYDAEQASGILLNLTLRNYLGSGSRLLGTIDLAEYPKLRLHYQNLIGKRQRWWYFSGVQYERYPLRLFTSGRLQNELLNNFNSVQTGLNYSLSQNEYAGFAVSQDWSYVRAKITPDTRLNPQDSDFWDYTLRNLSVSANYYKNTFDRYLYPTKGSKVILQLKYLHFNNYNLEVYSTDTASHPENKIQKSDVLNPAFKVTFAYTPIIKFNRHISLVNNVFAGLILDNIIKRNKNLYTDNGFTDFFFIGGSEQRSRINAVPFFGYREWEITASQAIIVRTELQCEVFDKLYLIPGIAVKASGKSFTPFIQNIANWNFTYGNGSNKTAHAFGYGLTVAYRSFAGPISFTLSKATGVKDFIGYFTFGYKF